MTLWDLDAFWLPDPQVHGGRYGMGISLTCPMHGDKVYCWFAKPLDGFPPEPSAEVLHERTNSTIDDMTLIPEIKCPNGWRAYVLEGRVIPLE